MWNSLVNPDKVVMYELHEGVVLEEKHLLQQLASPRLDAAAAAGKKGSAVAAVAAPLTADGQPVLVDDISSGLKDLHVRDSVGCARFEVYQSPGHCRQDGAAVDAGAEELPAAAALKATVTKAKDAMVVQRSKQAAMKKKQAQNPKVSSAQSWSSYQYNTYQHRNLQPT